VVPIYPPTRRSLFAWISSAAEVAAKVAAKVSDGGMGGETYLAYKNDAWDRLVEYYESLNK
jgi:hypothetical protein